MFDIANLPAEIQAIIWVGGACLALFGAWTSLKTYLEKRDKRIADRAVKNAEDDKSLNASHKKIRAIEVRLDEEIQPAIERLTTISEEIVQQRGRMMLYEREKAHCVEVMGEVLSKDNTRIKEAHDRVVKAREAIWLQDNITKK